MSLPSLYRHFKDGHEVSYSSLRVTELVSGKEHTKSEGLSNLKLCSFSTNALHMNDLGGGKQFLYCVPKST